MPYVCEIGMLRELPLAEHDGYRVLANPIKLEGKRVPSRRAPKLGEHTEAVLREAGLDDTEIEALRNAGVL